MIRIYTKPKGQIPDYNEPVILHDTNPSLEMFCNRIHRVSKAVLSQECSSPPCRMSAYRAARFVFFSIFTLVCDTVLARLNTNIFYLKRSVEGEKMRVVAGVHLCRTVSLYGVDLWGKLCLRPVRVRNLCGSDCRTRRSQEPLQSQVPAWAAARRGMPPRDVQEGSRFFPICLKTRPFPPPNQPFRRDRKCAHNPAVAPGYIAPPQVRVGVGVEREAPADEDGQGPPPQRRGRGADCQEGLGQPFFFAGARPGLVWQDLARAAQ